MSVSRRVQGPKGLEILRCQSWQSYDFELFSCNLGVLYQSWLCCTDRLVLLRPLRRTKRAMRYAHRVAGEGARHGRGHIGHLLNRAYAYLEWSQTLWAMVSLRTRWSWASETTSEGCLPSSWRVRALLRSSEPGAGVSTLVSSVLLTLNIHDMSHAINLSADSSAGVHPPMGRKNNARRLLVKRQMSQITPHRPQDQSSLCNANSDSDLRD